MIWPFNRKPQEVKESQAYRLHYQRLPAAAWSLAGGRGNSKFASEGYSQSVVAYQAIRRVQDAAASVPLLFKRGDAEVDGGPLRALIERPNPMQSGPDFMRARIGFLLIYGNEYVEGVTGTGREYAEMWPLRPDRVSLLPGEDGLLVAYEYGVGGRKVRLDADDVLHVKMFNPLDDFTGLSPMQAAAYGVDQHNEAMKWLQSLLQNQAVPSGALVASGDPLNEDQFARLKTEMESQYQGAQNAGRPMLLEGGLDWRPMGQSPGDMGIIDIKHSAARDTALAFGVPPMLLGIPGDNTYSNYKEARLALWEDTVIPLLTHMLDETNRWLEPRFGQTIEPDFAAVPAIAEKSKEMWSMADKSLELTVNEVREIKGYEPLPDPLGSMLMAELVKRQAPQEPQTAAQKAYRLAYGP